MSYVVNAPDFNRRVGTSTLVGQAVGRAVSNATSMHLQGQMQDMFDQKKQARDSERESAARMKSAEGLTNFLVSSKYAPKEEASSIRSFLSQLSQPDQMKFLDLSMKNGPAFQSANNAMSGGKVNLNEIFGNRPPSSTQGQQIQQQPIYTQQEQTNPPALERTGNLGQYPESPNQPTQIPYLQGYQPQLQQNKPITMSGGEIPPQRQTAGQFEQPKQVNEKTLGEMTPEEFEQYKKLTPRTAWKGLAAARDRQKKVSAVEKANVLTETKIPREEEQKNVQTFITGSQNRMSQIPEEEALLNLATESINQNQFGLLSPDNLADYTGVEQFRTATGEGFRTAVKDYFLKDIKQTGGRPNMFIEKMLSSILPNVGKSKQANMAWIEVQKLKIDLDKEKQRLIEQYSPDHVDANGNIKGSLINSVNKDLAEFANTRQEATAYALQKNREEGSSLGDLQSLKNSKGTPLTEERAKVLNKMVNGDREKLLKVIKETGYVVPDKSIIYLYKQSHQNE